MCWRSPRRWRPASQRCSCGAGSDRHDRSRTPLRQWPSVAQDTEWVMTAVYGPATALDGTGTSIRGSHVAEVFPATLVALTTGWSLALRLVAGMKLKVADPVVCRSAAIR